MPWSGTGTFTRLYSWVNDRIAGIPITASRMDADTNDIVNNGLDNCLTRDGQGIATADLPMGTFKHTGVGPAVLPDQYAQVAQVQNSAYVFKAGGGTGDAITAAYAPTINALPDGITLIVTAPSANTVTAPTFSPNALTARPITKRGGAALAVGEYASGQRLILSYSVTGTRWELITSTAVPAISDKQILANNSGVAALPTGLTLTQVLDFLSTTAGTILRRGASAWASTPQPSFFQQSFSSSGTFTIPSNATTATRFRFRVLGPGGGGGSTSNATSAGGGGSAGSLVETTLSGFVAGDTLTITIGSFGAGGVPTTGNGSDGGTTLVVYSGHNIISASGGKGGGNGSVTGFGGASVSGAVNLTGTSLSADSTVVDQSQPGHPGIFQNNGGCGGSSPFGGGGIGTLPTAAGAIGNGYGSGGAGGCTTTTPGESGGNGTNGLVIIDWTL